MNEDWITPKDGFRQMGLRRFLAMVGLAVLVVAGVWVAAVVYLVGFGA